MNLIKILTIGILLIMTNPIVIAYSNNRTYIELQRYHKDAPFLDSCFVAAAASMAFPWAVVGLEYLDGQNIINFKLSSPAIHYVTMYPILFGITLAIATNAHAIIKNGNSAYIKRIVGALVGSIMGTRGALFSLWIIFIYHR